MDASHLFGNRQATRRGSLHDNSTLGGHDQRRKDVPKSRKRMYRWGVIMKRSKDNTRTLWIVGVISIIIVSSITLLNVLVPVMSPLVLPSGYQLIRRADKSIVLIGPRGQEAIEGPPFWIIDKIAIGDSCFAAKRLRIGSGVLQITVVNIIQGTSTDLDTEQDLNLIWETTEQKPIIWNDVLAFL